jgi:predicted RecA/RadA family phage recombinase
LIYRAIKITPADNVAVAVTDIPAEETVVIPDGGEMVVSQEIPLGHKICLQPISAGEGVIRYGEVICLAAGDIRPGDWVHVHNTEVEKH